MRPYTSTQMQRDIDDINAKLTALLELAAVDGYGIVSTIKEAITPDKLAVSFNSDTNRLEVTAGTFVTPEGQVCVVPGDVTDLVWPLGPLLYVTLYSSMVITDVVDAYQQTATAKTEPDFELAVLDADALIALGNSAVVVAVLRRSDELDEVDTTDLVLEDNRRVFSLLDFEHRAKGKEVGDDRNPHGTGLDQVSIGGISLLRQIHSAGFVATTADGAAGIPGTHMSQTLVNMAQPDPIGRIVAPGHYYIRLDSYPTQMPVVVSATTALPVQFNWLPGTNIFDFGLVDPGDVVISYFQLPDVEVQGTEVGVVTRFRGVGDGAVISDGAITYPKTGEIDVSAFAGMAMMLDVVVDAAGTYQVVPELIGSVQPTKSKVPTTSFPYKTKTASQLAFAVTGSQLYGRVLPPSGRLDVVDTDFLGRYQFMYTISVPETVTTLTLTGTGFGSYAAPVPFPRGSLSRSGKAVDPRYFNVVDGVLYLESRAFSPKYTYTYTVPGSESKRFQRSYTEAKGALSKPTGVAAKGSLAVLGALAVGDAVNVRFEPTNPVVRKAYGVDFSGSTKNDIATSLAAALNADLLFALKAKATSAGATVKIVSLVLGSAGNAYSITVDGSALSSKFSVHTFSGGSSYLPSIADVTGASLRISQPNQNFPAGARINVYMTDNLDEDGDANLFYKAADIEILDGVHVYDVTMTEDVTSLISTTTPGYDLTKQFQMTFMVQGSDGTGASVSDTVNLTENNIFEVDGFGDPLQFVTTKSVYAVVAGIVVSASANTGTATAVVLGQALSRNSSRSRIAEITTNREGVLSVKDTRIMHPASLDPNPVTQSDALTFGLVLSRNS